MTNKIGCIQHDCDDCKNRIRQLSEVTARMRRLEAAIKNLRDQKGRHNTEIAYKQLMELVK